ncbi:MAG: patatin-like phospholipase family protein, partial [Desulfitobacterium hafniense]|nr:patatin-like phospholipase family protein [Desulfitobacterium hafniense]
KGYQWEKLAGTSAGSIIAALLAVGYTGKEIKTELDNLDYRLFLDTTTLQAVPVVGKLFGLIYQRSIHSGDYIEKWMKGLLRKKGKVKFRDVVREGESRLKIIASDITRKELLVLPDDLVKYGINPWDFEIAKAVRMSASIPFYFKPVELDYDKEFSLVVDGGILSNFPVWIFDVEGTPRWPTFGFKLVSPGKSFTASGKTDIISYLKDIISTMLEENDARYIQNSDYIRTIPIPTLGIGTTKFSLSKEDSNKLFKSGYEAAKGFLDAWNFDNYVRDYRIPKKATD